MSHVLLLLLLILLPNSIGEVIALSRVDDFTDFAINANSGSTYPETTACLSSDVTLTESIDPIGYYAYQFCGVFDEQGHISSSLKITSSSEYAGLFGYSTGD